MSTSHPLRHAVLNVVRKVADYRASSHKSRRQASTSTTSLASPTLLSPSPSPPPPLTPIIVEGTNPLGTPTSRNGSHYLLTGLTLFMSHEPCPMCSMALLHSRVKEIFYLVPMERTGGCGGAACVPKLEGVNHRYGISRWKIGEDGLKVHSLEVDDSIDA